MRSPVFPSCGGAFQARDEEALRADLQKLFFKQRDGARSFIRRTPQTNETGRAALMLLGFSEIAKRTGLPLRLREAGASTVLICFSIGFIMRLIPKTAYSAGVMPTACFALKRNGTAGPQIGRRNYHC